MSLADTVQLAADPALPRRDPVLDTQAIAERLATRLGRQGEVRVESCERWRVKYRVGTSLRVLFRIKINGSEHFVAARAFSNNSSGGRSAYQRALTHAIPVGSLHPVLYDSELDTVFWTFPNDRKIASLAALVKQPPPFTDVLQGKWTSSRLVAYAPEKSATVQCLDAAGTTIAYVKVYADDAGSQIETLYSTLADSLVHDPLAASHLQLPEVLVYLPEKHMLVLEAVAGQRLDELTGAALQNGMQRLGVALATLHRLPPPALPGFARFEPEAIRKAARVIGAVRPDVAHIMRDLARALSHASWHEAGPLVCVHGDLHPKNGLLASDGLALIDLDQAALGPAAADIGGLLAGLRYQQRTGALPERAAQELARAFLAGYRSIAALPDVATLRWHVAAALLVERALRAVNRIRPEGLAHLEDILHDAHAALAGHFDTLYDAGATS